MTLIPWAYPRWLATPGDGKRTLSPAGRPSSHMQWWKKKCMSEHLLVLWPEWSPCAHLRGSYLEICLLKVVGGHDHHLWRQTWDFNFWSMYSRALLFICLSHVQLFVILWTVACQDPLSMGFPSKNTRVGILPRGSAQPGVQSTSLHWQADSLPLSHQGSPYWG